MCEIQETNWWEAAYHETRTYQLAFCWVSDDVASVSPNEDGGQEVHLLLLIQQQNA